MYSFLFIYTLKSKEDRDAFLAELLANNIPEICKAEDGCALYSYCLPVDCDNKLYIVESWESEEKQIRHTKQPHCCVIRGLKNKYGVDSQTVKL